MKIYKVEVLAEAANKDEVALLRAKYPECQAWPLEVKWYPCWKVTRRLELSHTTELSAKQIAKMLPA